MAAAAASSLCRDHLQVASESSCIILGEVISRRELQPPRKCSATKKGFGISRPLSELPLSYYFDFELTIAGLILGIGLLVFVIRRWINRQ